MDGDLSSYNESVSLFSLLFACKTSPPPNKTLHMPLMGPLLHYNRQGPIGAHSLPPLLLTVKTLDNIVKPLYTFMFS